ncbi:phage tail tape measure protein, partial [Halolactibacillus halophilus]
MKGFGLEADEAFDLMAKGAQNGLNFSNEMFDNLSEYSTLFGNMGYSAEEYFELLQKGTEAGVYNLDYINDVMKEFQIRVKDGSKTTSDAMDKLSEETQTVWKEFNKGDKTVKDVSNAVLKELKGMDDQVSANQVGVELFGTKFEDLESEAMYALGDIGDGLEDVDGTMDDMTKNTERSISRQWKSTWREAKEVLLPVGETLLDFTREVLPDVKDGIEGVTEWFEELDEEGKKNIIMFGGIAAAAGPVLSVVGGLSSGIGGLLKVGGSLSALLGKAGGTALLGKLGALGLTGPVGMAVAGVAGLTAVTYGLSKATEENLEDTLSSIDTRKKEIESVDELIEKFGALQEKNKLSSDEILRYMDISDELKEAKTEKTIEKLKDEQADLLKKSKLTNEEMEEFLELNEEVVKKAPATSSVISDQGNAYADVLEKLEDLNEAERNRLMNDTYDAITEELNNHKVALEKQKDLQIEIAKQESDRSTRLDELNKLSEELKQKDLDIADIKKEMSTLSGEERLKLSEKLLQEEEARRLLVSQKEGHEEIISKIDKTISKKKESLDDTKEELAAFNDLAGEYEAMILKQVNINAEKGKGLKTVESEIETLEKKRQKYIELSRENDGNTQAYKDQAKELGEQISKLDAAKKELENINEIAGRTIYQSRIVNVKFHARYSGFKTGDSANIGLVGGGGYQEYAKGTDY